MSYRIHEHDQLLKLTERCLASVINQNCLWGFATMLVDDSSETAVLQQLQKVLNYQFILRQVNFGSVSSSINLICRESFQTDKFAVVLNNDVELLPGALEALLYFAHGTNEGLITGFEVIPDGSVVPGGYAAFLIQKSLFDLIGPFDENILGIGLQEWDYCERLKEKGLSNTSCPAFRFRHEKSVTKHLFPEMDSKSIEYYRKKWGNGKHHLP